METPPAVDGVTWTAQHAAAWQAYLRGEHLAVLGPGGTGKSTLLRCIVDHALERDAAEGKVGGVLVTGSTGRAAINVSDCVADEDGSPRAHVSTFHSAIGLGRQDGSAEELARLLVRGVGARRGPLRSVRLFVIDEISMLEADKLEAMALFWRQLAPAHDLPAPEDPWGGLVQVVMFGDPLQLPPVVKGVCKPWEAAERAGDYMFFRAPCFRAVRGVILSRVFRQRDAAFISALALVRLGRWAPAAQFMVQRLGQSFEARGVRAPEVVPHVMPRRDAAAAHNRSELAKLPGASRTYLATFDGPSGGCEKLRNGCRAPALLELKVGATVVVVANVNVAAGVANGAQAVVTELGDDFVDVDVDGTAVTLRRHRWTLRAGGGMAVMKQIPLILGFAMTIHACQGMTLRWLRASLKNVWDLAQVYVVLSRVTEPDGLHLVDLDLPRLTRLAPPSATLEYLANLKI